MAPWALFLLPLLVDGAPWSPFSDPSRKLYLSPSSAGRSLYVNPPRPGGGDWMTDGVIFAEGNVLASLVDVGTSGRTSKVLCVMAMSQHQGVCGSSPWSFTRPAPPSP